MAAPDQTFHKAYGFNQKNSKEPVLVKVSRQDSEQYLVEYSLPTAAVTKSAALSEKAVSVDLGSAPKRGDEGKPILPVVPLKLILPPGKTIASVEAQRDERYRIAGTHMVEHNAGYFPLLPDANGKPVEPDKNIYGADNVFPAKASELVTIQKKRGVSIAVININPVEYFPRSGKLYGFSSIRLKVQTRQEKAVSRLKPRIRKVDVKALGVENPDEIDSYISKEISSSINPFSSVRPTAEYDYLIITSQDIIDATTEPNIQDLAQHREARGLKTIIESIENVLESYSGVDDAEKLRNYIIDAYNDWGISYVLLGGDVNIIPMRKLYCTASAQTDHIPSDLYFQCLDGNYNSDNDLNWGEPNDGEGGTDVDLLAEVYIGRASAENADEMSNLIYKTIAYETSADDPYFRSALMCGEHLGFSGVSEYAKNSMEEIRLGADSHGYTTAGFAANESFTVGTLYDADDPNNNWPKSTLIDHINSETYSIINHLGHASYNYVMKLYNSDASYLTNDKFLFAYSQGCIPGDFERDCIAERFTTSSRTGMYAVVYNSRFGWGSYNSTDGPSQRFNRQFWDAYFAEGMNTLGEINADSHEDNIWDINGSCIRWCFYETNLLGDPAVVVRGQYTGPQLVSAGEQITETVGNDDGFYSPGEELDIDIALSNIGVETSYQVSAVLQTSDQNVTLVHDAASYGDIQTGQTVSAENPFAVRIASNCPTPRSVPFVLSVTDADGNSWDNSFSLEINRVEQITGTVSSFTGSHPIDGAVVTYTGPISGEAATDENGMFEVTLIDGEYDLYASKDSYLPTETVAITVPSSVEPIEFVLYRPQMHVQPDDLRAVTSIGNVTEKTFSITNDGDYDLQVDFATEYTGTLPITAESVYDKSHFVAPEKGKSDTRVGKPVKYGFGGPDAFGYSWRDSDEPEGPQYEWNDISSSGSRLSISSYDDSYEPVDLDFIFKFYDNYYRTAYVSTNGYITFGRGSSQFSNFPIPDSSSPPNLVAGFFDDLCPAFRGDIYFQNFDDHAIIQYQNVAPYHGSGSYTFQIVLYEDGKIRLYYNNLVGTTNSSTVGIQNRQQTIGLQVAYNASYLQNEMAIEFTDQTEWISYDHDADVIAPGATHEYAVSLGNPELGIGDYRGSILIGHNDPRLADNPYQLPVYLSVTEEGLPPEIVTHPEDQTVAENSAVTFTVDAVGENLHYQWQRDGMDIVGAVSAEFQIEMVEMADDSASFRCIVSNDFGSVESNAAQLNVVPQPPVIVSHPEDQTVLVGESVQFGVEASGYGLSYQWLRDGVEITGETSPRFQIAEASLLDDGSGFSCVVSNEGGEEISEQAFLTVSEQTLIHAGMIRVGVSAQGVSRTDNYVTKEVFVGSSSAGKMTGSRYTFFAQ
ncbi:MAG: C25 family cysteine peptidase [Fibrobacterota bacterium]